MWVLHLVQLSIRCLGCFETFQARVDLLLPLTAYPVARDGNVVAELALAPALAFAAACSVASAAAELGALWKPSNKSLSFVSVSHEAGNGLAVVVHVWARSGPCCVELSEVSLLAVDPGSWISLRIVR